MSGARPYLLLPDEHVEHGDSGVKASRESTAGAFTLIESRAEGGAPPHVHSREDEAMYVLEGRIAARCEDARFDARRGSFVFLPRGLRHSWDVVGDAATVLIITAPAGLEEFLRDFHNARGAERRNVGARYGIRFL